MLTDKYDLDHWTAPIDEISYNFEDCPVSSFHVSFHITINQCRSKQFVLQKLNNNSKLSLLLMLAGDVNPNPGPQQLKYPCQICNTAARWGQECIECENCNHWFHKFCLGMNDEIYDALAKHASYSWLCTGCGLPSFQSSYFMDINGLTTDNSFNVLSDLNDDVSIDSLPPDLNDCKPNKTSSPIRNMHTGTEKTCKPKNCKSKPKTRSLKMLNVNCQSASAKNASFRFLIQEEDPDVIVGTESWLHCNIPSGEIFPSHYNIFRKDRDNQSDHHGGVFIAVKNDLIAQDENDMDQGTCELKWISIHVSGIAPVYIGAFYRSQKTDSDYVRLLENSLQGIPKHASVWILGDFNLPDVNWVTNTFTPCGRYPGPSKTMLDIALDYNLQQVVLKPTRENSILDLCFTTNPAFVNSVEVKPGISDHDVVVIDASIRPKIIKLPKRKVFLYKKADFDKVAEDLDALNGELTDDVVQQTDINELWNRFTDTIKKSMDSNIPSKMTSSKPSVPWINSNVKRNIRKKRKLYDKARKTGDFELWDRFKELRRKTDRQMRKLHRDHVRGIGDSLQSENTKPFWNYVKALRRDVFGVSPLSSMGRIASSAKEKAEALNKQFCSVFTREELSSIPTLGTSTVPDMPDIEISVTGVEKLLRNLKVNKAPGPDNIPARILQECASSVAPLLQKIYQKSISSGSLPQDWLNANVSPIFKKGDRSLPSNYRPVSLTCIASKQLEHILHSNIMNHLDKYSLLCDKQHGFRSGRSCETQLAGLVDDLAEILDKRGRADLCIMDFSKAFDMVPHQRLLAKIDHLGIRGNTKSWIKGFLTNRQQKVIIDGQSSTSSSVISGVPQGTVLGPLLFLAYINDLPNCVISYVRLFADDLILYRYITSSNDCDILQEDINSLCNWEKTWQMKFNITKCFIMHVTHKKSFINHQYYMGNTVLQKVDHHPYLGVELSNKLSWATHINQTVNKANSILGLLKRNLWSCSSRTKEIAYKTLVRPRLEYCSPIWDPHQKVHQVNLEKVQRRSARFVTGDYRRTSSVNDMLHDLNWETLQDRREKARLTLVYKETHHITPPNINHHLVTNSTTNKPTTRQSHELNYNIIRSNKDCYRYSLYPRTIPTWNALPASTKEASDVAKFKFLINNGTCSTRNKN